MPKHRLLLLIVVAALLLFTFTLPSTLASPPSQGKGPGRAGIQSIPTVDIQNSYLQALSSEGGRFVIGTTGGDPSTPDDDNKLLLFGYPINVGSSFSTLRVTTDASSTDYRLGATNWDATGVAPISSPNSDGSTLKTIWEIDGIRVEERLYFTHPGEGWGQPTATAIEYDITNNNASNRDVGLRILLDTQIGGNDGAPFFVLGLGQLSQEFEFSGTNIPQYWTAYESPTFDPDSLQGLGQLSGSNATRPDRFVIAHWGDDLCNGIPGLFDTNWDYSINPNFAMTCDSAAALYYNPVTLAPGEARTLRTYYGVAPQTQLLLTGLEVTQAVQDLENSVVLIQDKPTFVRAHVRSTSGTINDVTARLIGRRNSNELPSSPLSPANIGGNIDVLESPDRSQLKDSFLFELPDSWREGTIELEFAGVSHTIACRDHTDTDNDCKATVTFEGTPSPEVRLVGVIWHEGNDPPHDPTEADYRAVAQDIEAQYPIPELDWDNPYELEYILNGPPNLFVLNLRLGEQRILDGCISWWPINCNRLYFGLLVDYPGGNTGLGLGQTPGSIASGFYRLTDPTTPAHEIGHNFGRLHTACGSPNDNNTDSNYPYSNGHISQEDTGDNALYGFHITSTEIIPSNKWDLMSYCRRRWVSDWTYEALRDAINDRFGSSRTSSFSPSLLAAEEAVLVSGLITPTESFGTIESVVNVEFPGSIPTPPPGSYAIRFEDSGGQELASHSFEPDPVSEGSTQIFSLLLPRNASTTRILLLHNGQELDSRTASANAPTVTVISPNGGESLSGPTAMLSWSANDADGDPLEYVVQYSTDAGTTWQTLVTAWPSTTYELNLELIAGTDQGLLRVLANDGFHTGQDQSDGTFTVTKHAPQVYIQRPEDNSLYVGNQTIILEGRAYDNEDGQLGDIALSWSSSLDGALGSGHSLDINASTLVEGTHIITLTAQDSDGQTSTDSITIEIYRERPTLPANLAIAPTSLSFVAEEGGTQTNWQSVSIRNDGDGTMTWSATPDQNWILVSSLEGIAPADILFAADPTGLSAGEYTANITITAPGTVNSQQIIQVTLNVQDTFPIYLPLILH